MTVTGERAELEAERDSLLRSLREIDAEQAAGELTGDEYALLRDQYTARAGAVLRRLEEIGADRPAAPAPAEPPDPGDLSAPTGPAPTGPAPTGPAPTGAARRRSRRRLRVAVAVVGAALVAAGAVAMAAGGSGSRGAGQPVSGSVPPSPGQELSAARHAMATGDQVTALRLYQAVLNAEPDQPEALAYSGWLLRLAGVTDNQPGLVNQAMAAEEAAEAADPKYPDPYFFLGVILLDDRHQPAAAADQLRRYLAMQPSPSVRATVAPLLARAQSEAAAGAGGGAGGAASP